MGFHEGAFGFGSNFAPTCNRDSLAAFASDADRLLYLEHNRKQELALAALCKCHKVNRVQAVAPATTAQYMKQELEPPFVSKSIRLHRENTGTYVR